MEVQAPDFLLSVNQKLLHKPARKSILAPYFDAFLEFQEPYISPSPSPSPEPALTHASSHKRCRQDELSVSLTTDQPDWAVRKPAKRRRQMTPNNPRDDGPTHQPMGTPSTTRSSTSDYPRASESRDKTIGQSSSGGKHQKDIRKHQRDIRRAQKVIRRQRDIHSAQKRIRRTQNKTETSRHAGGNSGPARATEGNGNYWRGGRQLRNTGARRKIAAGQSVYTSYG